MGGRVVTGLQAAKSRKPSAAARPVPGNFLDARAWRDSALAQHWEGVTVPAVGAYIHSGLLVPYRERLGRALLSGEEEGNAEHRRVRVRGECVFAHMKRYKILRGCRQRDIGLEPGRRSGRPSLTSGAPAKTRSTRPSGSSTWTRPSLRRESAIGANPSPVPARPHPSRHLPKQRGDVEHHWAVPLGLDEQDAVQYPAGRSLLQALAVAW
ncbi:hypothetical protein KME66_02395 [Streptomyces sp. YPW6]|uniref:transposase family protein n=1 Tax=Streptomyces sp. YPW6 TaxID=2840373 RepID=UPI001C0CB399|nr:hypothetical protein KME66_02395 [Streptomyces sp. YPW6]